MKGFKRSFALVFACVIALSSFNAFAEEAAVSDMYVTDPSVITNEHDTPSLSFDTDKWEDYVEPLNVPMSVLR